MRRRTFLKAVGGAILAPGLAASAFFSCDPMILDLYPAKQTPLSGFPKIAVYTEHGRIQEGTMCAFYSDPIPKLWAELK